MQTDKAILTGREAQRLAKGFGQNLFYKMLKRGEIPGAINIGQGAKAIWRVKAKPFLAWLNGDEPKAKTPSSGAA